MDLFLHPGKRRLATDSKDLIAELAAEADIVVLHATTADEVISQGFDDWSTPLKVAITPFGRTGPKCNWRATSNVLLAMGGYTQLMGDVDREPLTLPGHYVDFQSGQFAYTAVNACLFNNQANVIDVSMFESVMTLSQFTTVMWHCAQRERARHGSDFWWVVPSNLFKCSDGWVYINTVPTFWDALTVFLDMPELVVDQRFADNDLRMENRDALHDLMATAIIQWDKKTIRQRATDARIPAGVVQTFAEVLKDKHLAARSFFQTVEDGPAEFVSPSLPFRFNNDPRPSFSLNGVEAKAMRSTWRQK